MMIARDLSEGVADHIVANLTEEQAAEMISNLERSDAERVALRERIKANSILRSATCPATSWKDADSRYDVTSVAVSILDATAAKYGLPVDALASQLIEDKGTLQNTIDLHGTDPRMDGFGTGNFYAFRCRVRDAVRYLKAEADKAESKAREAARDAAWAKQGLERCTRCGGAGGWKGWPGYTCYECNGHGAVPTEEGEE